MHWISWLDNVDGTLVDNFTSHGKINAFHLLSFALCQRNRMVLYECNWKHSLTAPQYHTYNGTNNKTCLWQQESIDRVYCQIIRTSLQYVHLKHKYIQLHTYIFHIKHTWLSKKSHFLLLFWRICLDWGLGTAPFLQCRSCNTNVLHIIDISCHMNTKG